MFIKKSLSAVYFNSVIMDYKEEVLHIYKSIKYIKKTFKLDYNCTLIQ